MTWIEISGFVLTIIGVFLSVYQNIWVWPVNILSPVAYVVLFYKNQLFGDMALQVFFIALAVYGGFQWSRQEMKPKSAVRFLAKRGYYFYSLITIIFFTFIYFILKNYTQTDVALYDGILTALSITATILAAKKFIENWIIWIIADAAYVFLLMYKNLYLTAILYGILVVLAAYGLLAWRKEWKSQ